MCSDSQVSAGKIICRFHIFSMNVVIDDFLDNKRGAGHKKEELRGWLSRSRTPFNATPGRSVAVVSPTRSRAGSPWVARKAGPTGCH